MLKEWYLAEIGNIFLSRSKLTLTLGSAYIDLHEFSYREVKGVDGVAKFSSIALSNFIGLESRLETDYLSAYNCRQKLASLEEPCLSLTSLGLLQCKWNNGGQSANFPLFLCLPTLTIVEF